MERATLSPDGPRCGNQRELQQHLCEQLRFLQIAAAAYDGGEPEAAKMLATTMRVLVHDTHTSHSVLGQLGCKETLRSRAMTRDLRRDRPRS